MQETTNETKFNEEEIDNLIEATVEIDKNPLTFLRKNGKEGFKIIRGMISTVVLFGFINFLLIIYSAYKYFSNESETVKIAYLFLAIIACVAFVIISYIKSYRNAITKTINLAYDKFNFLLKKLCNLIIEKVDTIFKTKKENIKSEDLKKVINVYDIADKTFTKLPKFVVKGITLLLNRIPIMDLVLDFKNDILQGKKTEASEKLFTKVDTQVKESLLSEASKSWVYWLLPLNIIVVLVIVFLKLA